MMLIAGNRETAKTGAQKSANGRGQANQPTEGKIKGREVRRGRVAQERRKIRHFAQGATGQDNVRIRTSRWKIDTLCTLRASAP